MKINTKKHLNPRIKASAFSKAERVTPELAMNNAGRCFFLYKGLESLVEIPVVMYGVQF
jgi:hypothetical protein